MAITPVLCCDRVVVVCVCVWQVRHVPLTLRAAGILLLFVAGWGFNVAVFERWVAVCCGALLNEAGG